MIKNISILGSTGSIGTNALKVVQNLNIKVKGLAAFSNINLLEKQIRIFSPDVVAVFEENAAYLLKERIKDTNIKILSGMSGLCEIATLNKSEILLNAVTGIVGLLPTLCAIEAKKNVALANKETLVAGGSLVMQKAKENNVKILPVDSEHSAIFQCLQGCKNKNQINRLILTASGGPFFGKDTKSLKNITKKDALNHPNWKMGPKITVDSATMMNKGLEIIEAAWLFGIDPDKIDVVVHRESIVHSMVEFIDNSVIAQLGVPDMKIPIQYALTYPSRCISPAEKLDLIKLQKLSFFDLDNKVFEGVNICKKAIKIGGTAPAIMNAANEEAVKLFLNDKISFLDIINIVKNTIKNCHNTQIHNIDDILNADKQARNHVKNLLKQKL